MSGLGGFAAGLQSGLETGTKIKRSRELDKLIGRERHLQDLEFGARKKDYLNEGGDPEAWMDYEETPDPFIFKAVDWLRGLGKSAGPDPAGTEGAASAMPTSSAPTSSTAIPEEYATQQLADGGPVNRARGADRRAARRPSAIPTEDEEESGGGGFGEYYREDLARHAANLPGAGVIPAIGEEVRSIGEDVKMRAQGIGRAENPRQAGAAVRETLGEIAIATPRAAVAGAKAALAPLAPAGEAILGFLGFAGEQKSRRSQSQPDPTADVPPPTAIPADAEVDTPEAAALQDVTSPAPAQDVAAAAVQNAGKTVPGHPDNDGQQFDWAEVREAGVTPDQIPHVGVKDWAEYRAQHVQAAAMRGKSTAEAHAEIDQIQARGLATNLQQAAYLLRAGDPESAALAARAAYQYFPNGSEVRFGIMNGPQGPVLVGMGEDEETGEPIMEGKPMVMTPDLMETMAENFSNPAALRTWTKDWHDQRFQDQKYAEVDKPTAQADLDLKGAQTELAYAGAERNRAEAEYARSGKAGAGGGLKQSDYDRNYEVFRERQELQSLEDPAAADYLASVMSILFKQDPSIPNTTIIAQVMRAYEAGTLDEALQSEDINETFAQLGLR